MNISGVHRLIIAKSISSMMCCTHSVIILASVEYVNVVKRCKMYCSPPTAHQYEESCIIARKMRRCVSHLGHVWCTIRKSISIKHRGHTLFFIFSCRSLIIKFRIGILFTRLSSCFSIKYRFSILHCFHDML